MMHKPLLNEDLLEIYQSAKENFNKLQGKHIILTGGTGFFGKWIIESINYANSKLEQPIEVTTFSRDPSTFLEDNPHFKEINCLSIEKADLQYEVPDITGANFVIHTAANVRTQVSEEERQDYISKELELLENVLTLTKRNSVERLLFTSSGAVYGPLNSKDPFPQELKIQSHNNSPYGEAKIIAEKRIISFCEEECLTYNIARCFAFIGPLLPLDGSYAAGNFILNAHRKEEIVIKGDGSPIRSYLYMTDLISALLILLVGENQNDVFNIGSNKAISISELAKDIANQFEGLSIRVTNQVRSTQLIPSYVPNIDKAYSKLKWKPIVELKEGIKRFKRWLEAN